jgi:signal transduction histidine kinase
LTIKASLGADGESVEFAVRDNGEGIDAHHRLRIYDAFFSTRPGGMGMGLAIARSIVEAHGSTLALRPNPGGGEVFHFSLRACKEPSA